MVTNERQKDVPLIKNRQKDVFNELQFWGYKNSNEMHIPRTFRHIKVRLIVHISLVRTTSCFALVHIILSLGFQGRKLSNINRQLHSASNLATW